MDSSPTDRGTERCSTTDTECIASTIMNRRRHSISPPKPKRSSRCVPNSGRSTPGVWGSSFPAAACLENRTLFQRRRCCHLPRPGFFATAPSTAKARTSSRKNGRTRNPLEPEAYYQALEEVFSAEPPPVFQWSGADRRIADRWTGYQDDHGLAEVSSGISALLLLRGAVTARVRMSSWRAEWQDCANSPTR